MGFLSLSVGICCLFFMSTSGIIHCLLNCALGSLFSYLTYATHTQPKRWKARIAIVGNVLHILLLVSTIVQGSLLLRANVEAGADNNEVHTSSTFSSILDYYFEYAEFDEQSSVALRFRTSLHENASISSMPFVSKEKARASRSGNEPGSTINANGERFTSIIASLSSISEDVSGARRKGDGHIRAKANSKTPADLGEEQSQSTPKIGVSSAIAQWGRSKNLPPSYNFSNEDRACATKAVANEAFGESVFKRLRSLLYWGLFCGYSARNIILPRQWLLSCEEECHFNMLNFSRFEHDSQKQTEQAMKFVKALQGMTKAEARFCIATATVAACRIEEMYLHHGVAAALCAALPLSFVLAIFCITCIVACYRKATNAPKVQRT